jgi:hypothetical protein
VLGHTSPKREGLRLLLDLGPGSESESESKLTEGTLPMGSDKL